MLRKTSQLLLLPILFALLAAGGRTTLCEVFSVIGMESHHHAHEGAPGGGGLCLETHDHDHDHDHAPGPAQEDAPCPESCEIPLAEATAPVLLKVPALAETCVLPSLLRAMLAARVPDEFFDAVAKVEPPDRADSLVDPIFTGRFLV